MIDFEQLLARADAAKNSAYAPYSKFHVGAAVLSVSGQIYTGCNVENIAFPIGGCAEHHAIAAAVLVEGRDLQIQGVAVSAIDHTGQHAAVAPCGACRQMIHEFGPKARVHFLSLSGQLTIQDIGTLLPESFHFLSPIK